MKELENIQPTSTPQRMCHIICSKPNFMLRSVLQACLPLSSAGSLRVELKLPMLQDRVRVSASALPLNCVIFFLFFWHCGEKHRKVNDIVHILSQSLINHANVNSKLLLTRRRSQQSIIVVKLVDRWD